MEVDPSDIPNRDHKIPEILVSDPTALYSTNWKIEDLESKTKLFDFLKDPNKPAEVFNPSNNAEKNIDTGLSEDELAFLRCVYKALISFKAAVIDSIIDSANAHNRWCMFANKTPGEITHILHAVITEDETWTEFCDLAFLVTRIGNNSSSVTWTNFERECNCTLGDIATQVSSLVHRTAMRFYDYIAENLFSGCSGSLELAFCNKILFDATNADDLRDSFIARAKVTARCGQLAVELLEKELADDTSVVKKSNYTAKTIYAMTERRLVREINQHYTEYYNWLEDGNDAALRTVINTMIIEECSKHQTNE